jgi:DeoR/GlpR family transcriptional regulator of sugar metabolism
LAESLEVSESTVRRDLDFLEQQGEAKRRHGGAIWIGSPANMRLFADREGTRWEQKTEIAVAAAELIDDHDTILLDGGSTTYELARQLVGRPLQIVTNSLPVANLFTSGETDLIFIGGLVHGRTGVSLGPYADKMLKEINVRRAVLSIAGADERGYYNSHLLLVETERAMARAADEVFVVADSSKFGHTSLARICELQDVHTVISDKELSQPWRERLRNAGVRLVIAGE